MTNRNKVRLTKRRERWAAQRAKAQRFVGAPLRPNAGIEAAYAASLEREVRAMADTVKREVADLFGVAMDARTDQQSQTSQARMLTNRLIARFAAHFAKFAPGLANRMMRRVDKATASQIYTSIAQATGGLSLKMPRLTGDVDAAFRASVAANVSLIKSIPERYLTGVQGAVLRHMQQGGRGAEGLLREIERLDAVTQRRARLIAVDQTRKATTALNDARLKKLGVRKFRWIHSGGGKEPRELHVHMNGQVYDLDNPPVIDEKTGERGLPGQLINCRCTMAPVIDFGTEDDGAAS